MLLADESRIKWPSKAVQLLGGLKQDSWCYGGCHPDKQDEVYWLLRKKDFAIYNEVDEVPKAIPFFAELSDNAIHLSTVDRF